MTHQEVREIVFDLLRDVTKNGTKRVRLADFAGLLLVHQLKESDKSADSYLRYLVKTNVINSAVDDGGHIVIWPKDSEEPRQEEPKKEEPPVKEEVKKAEAPEKKKSSCKRNQHQRKKRKRK